MIDKRSSEATEAEATAAAASEDLSDSATGASTSSYNYYPPPAQPHPPRYADFSSMVTSAHAQDKIGRSAQPKPGTDEFLHNINNFTYIKTGNAPDSFKHAT